MTRPTQLMNPRTMAAWAILCALAVGCGSPEPPPATNTDTGASATDAGGAVDANASEDSGGGADAGGGSDATTSDASSADSGAVEDSGGAGSDVAEDASAADATAGDAATGDAGAAADAGPPPKKLPLPDCAKSCDECAKCPETPMCVNGQTFLSDCAAICKLQAYDWPTGITLAQGKCPDCKACATNAGPDAKDAFCAKTKGGVYVPVKQECELECLELATPIKCVNGKCDGGSGASCTKDWQCSPKSEVIKGSCGKFNLCSQPKTLGGAECPVNAYDPVCSKKDGKTYATSCAMQACDLSGCFAVGKNEKTAQCDPGKMEAECPGECYDSAKYTGKCPSDCAPVCAVVAGGNVGPARTYRNGCIAKDKGASVLSCDGVSITVNGKLGACSSTMYASGPTKGSCCPSVDYSIIKQVCASKGQGQSAEWFTFRSQAEFECLTAGSKDWTFQYLGPCICNCNDNFKPVCGKDGVTYQNACQAKCYGGDKLDWTDGKCN